MVIRGLIIPATKIKYARFITWKTLFAAFKPGGNTDISIIPETPQNDVKPVCVTETPVDVVKL